MFTNTTINKISVYKGKVDEYTILVFNTQEELFSFMKTNESPKSVLFGGLLKKEYRSINDKDSHLGKQQLIDYDKIFSILDKFTSINKVFKTEIYKRTFLILD